MLVKRWIYLWLLASLALASCSAGKVITADSIHLKSNYCAPAPELYREYPYRPATNTDSVLRAHPNWKPHTLLTANATSTLELIEQLRRLDRDSTSAAMANRANLRSTIQHRLVLATTEIAGLAAELDCEGERADQLGRYLDNINSKRNNKLTVASILAAAVTTVLSVTLEDKGAQNWAAISGGAVAAGLAVMMLHPSGKKIQLQFNRNMLAAIWHEEDSSHIYSPFAWYMLTDPHFSYSGHISLAASIKGRWKEFDLGGKISADDEQKFFGNGGAYTADDLHTRAALLNELQSTIRSLNQDLQDLMQYLEEVEYPGGH